MNWGILTLIFSAFFIMFSVCSQYPGVEEMSLALFPFNDGYSHIFKTTYTTFNIWSLPGLYSGTFGFFYIAGRQIASMSKSGLLPAILHKSTTEHQVPYVAFIWVAILSFALNCIGLSSFLNDYFLVD